MADKEARFSIRLDSDAGEKSRGDAAALEELRSKIATSTASIKSMGAALRSLRGNTDEVKAAKSQLKAAIEAERTSVSSNTLALLKSGTTYEKLAAQARKAGGAIESIKSAGGPLADVLGKVEHLGKVATGSGAAFGILALAIAGVVGAASKLASILLDGAIALGRWALAAANALRSQNLLREAATGTAVDAEHLGHQLDALASKVATPRAELNDLAVSLTRSLSGTRASGQAIVDTFNAVAQASAALPGAGDQIKAIIERSKNFGRVSIDPFELQGSGISRDDVAAQLAKRMKIGLVQARAALATGRVSLEDGAAALRAAVEKQFGSLNLRKMLDLNVLAEKLHETLDQLTSGINLEPLLKGFSEITSLFSQATVTGESLKLAITSAAKALIGGFVDGVPTIQAVIKQLVIGLLKVEIEAFKIRNAWRKAFARDGVDIDWIQTATVYTRGLGDAAVRVADALGTAGSLAIRLWGVLSAASDRIKSAWDGLGSLLVDGLVDGLRSGLARIVSTVAGIASAAKEAFKSALGIHSPSKVFAEYGEQTAEGFAQGVEGGAGRAQRGVDWMAPGAPAGAGGGGSRGLTINMGGVVIHVTGASEKTAAQLTSASFMAEFTDMLEKAARAAAIPTQTPVPT